MTRLLYSFRRYAYFLCVFAAYPLALSAQTLKGTIVDSRTNETLIGATVTIVEAAKTQGTVTDANGRFTLAVSSFPVALTVSYVGYRTQEVDIYENPKEEIVFSLVEDMTRLNPVVVIGYQQTRKGSLTSAVSTVKLADIENIQGASITDKMQGAVAGLLVSNNSGVPGTSSLVRLRGATSITAGNSPIYIIDGAFVSTTILQQQDLGGQRIDPLADINPDDIESISVLKDASATAAYGARGANGVILVTTKRGTRNSKTSVNVNAEFGAARAENLWDLTTGPQHAEIVNKLYQNDGRWAERPFRPVGENPAGGTAYGLPEDQPTFSRIPDVFRTGFSQKYSLSVTGGTDKTNFYLGGEINKQESTLKMQDFSRNSFRLNLDHSISDRLKIGTSNMLSYTDRQLVRVGDGPAGLFQAALHTPTFYPVYNDDGTYNKPAAFDNHQAIIDHNDGHSKGLRIINNVYARWEIVKGLSFKTSWNNDRNIYYENFYYDTYLKDGSTNNGLAYDRNSWSNVFGTEQLFNYLQTFKEAHTVSAFLGNSWQWTVHESKSITGTSFPSNEFRRISSASSQTATTTGTSSALLSYFGGVNYSYRDRYSVDFTMRADGSSRVSSGNRWGYFPAMGASWNVMNEKFISRNKTLSDLRIKGSWGLVGNEAIDDFAALGLWAGGADYAGEAGVAPYQLPNLNLKWETTRQWNVGLLLGLLADRVTVELDYYDKYTRDLLLDEPLPGKTGLGSIIRNSGEVSNKGFELTVNSDNIKGKRFSWKTLFTLSHNKNVIKKLPREDQGAYTMFKLIEGNPLYSFWVWNYRGVDPATGDAVYEDSYGDDGMITIDDKKIVGNAWPKFEGIFKNIFTFGKFSLDVNFYFKQGNKLFNYTRMFLESGGRNGVGRSIQASALNYWKEENRGTYKVNGDGLITEVLPRPKSTTNADGLTNYETQSSRFVEDGSFIRLRNITLAYLLPKKWTSKLGVQRIGLYVTGSNLLLFTGYSGPDPEVSLDRDTRSLVQGLDFGTPPQPRSIVGGINITI